MTDREGEEPRLYTDLADWYDLLTAPSEYAEEAAYFLQQFTSALGTPPVTLLELGSGGGNMAFHWGPHPDGLRDGTFPMGEGLAEEGSAGGYLARSILPPHVAPDERIAVLGRANERPGLGLGEVDDDRQLRLSSGRFVRRC